MKHYAVNYLKSDSSRTPQTIFVKAKNDEEAVDKAYDLVGGFYHGDADLITAKRAKQIAVRFNPPFEWTLRQANSITPSGFSATMRGNLSSELMVSSWGGKRIIRGVVFKYKVDPDHYYFLYKEPLIRSSDPYRVAEATTGLTLGTPGKMKTVIRDAEERIRKFIAEHGKAKYDSLISSAEKLNHVEGGMVLKNPPFYAHNLYEKKTHGLNLHQMRRLYRMVSAGNQKAITYARNVLGIPFSESPTQVKAVVYHHVRDLAERRGLKRNAPWSKVKNAFAKAGFQFHAYGKVDDPATGKKLYDYYKGDSLTDGQKKIIQSIIPEVEFGGSQSQYAPEIRRPVVMFPVKRGLRRNPLTEDERYHLGRISRDPYLRRHFTGFTRKRKKARRKKR